MNLLYDVTESWKHKVENLRKVDHNLLLPNRGERFALYYRK